MTRLALLAHNPLPGIEGEHGASMAQLSHNTRPGTAGKHDILRPAEGVVRP